MSRLKKKSLEAEVYKSKDEKLKAEFTQLIAQQNKDKVKRAKEMSDGAFLGSGASSLLIGLVLSAFHVADYLPENIGLWSACIGIVMSLHAGKTLGDPAMAKKINEEFFLSALSKRGEKNASAPAFFKKAKTHANYSADLKKNLHIFGVLNALIYGAIAGSVNMAFGSRAIALAVASLTAPSIVTMGASRFSARCM